MPRRQVWRPAEDWTEQIWSVSILAEEMVLFVCLEMGSHIAKASLKLTM